MGARRGEAGGQRRAAAANCRAAGARAHRIINGSNPVGGARGPRRTHLLDLLLLLLLRLLGHERPAKGVEGLLDDDLLLLLLLDGDLLDDHLRELADRLLLLLGLLLGLLGALDVLAAVAVALGLALLFLLLLGLGAAELQDIAVTRLRNALDLF
jgi:hypothetical protein